MTNLVKWDPFEDLDELTKAFFGRGSSINTTRVPTADVYIDNNKQLVGEFQLPGFSDKDVEIDVHNGVLEVRGQRSEKQEEKDKKNRRYVVQESSNSFYRSISLPKHADTEAIEAHFNEGVLKVTVPFKELPKPKKIAIKQRSQKKIKK